MVGIEAVALFDFEVVFRHQHRHGRALWVVVLRRNVQNIRPDNFGDIRQNFSEALGIINFVYVFNVRTLVLWANRVADVVHVEAQCLGKVVKTVQLQFLFQGLNFQGLVLSSPLRAVKPTAG